MSCHKLKRLPLGKAQGLLANTVKGASLASSWGVESKWHVARTGKRSTRCSATSAYYKIVHGNPTVIHTKKIDRGW